MFKFLKDKVNERKVKALNKIKLSSFSNASSYPSINLTPQKLANILRDADAGDIYSQMELFEEMEEKDPHLFSQLQTRKNAVTGLDYEIIASSDDEKDKHIAEFVRKQIQSIKNFDGALLDLLDAIGKGISFVEIIWKNQNDLFIVNELKYIHQKHFFWDEEDTLKIKTFDNQLGVVVPKDKFIIHKYKARSGHSARSGLLRVVAWMYLFKNYDLKDWVTFVETYGMPIRVGVYNTSATEEEKRDLMNALIGIGADSAGIYSDNTDIKIHDNNKSASAQVYEKLARFCDEQISKAILGQTLTSDSGNGSYAQSKTHNEVRHDLTSADCKALSSTIKEYLITPLVKFNFGNSVTIPDFVFDFEEAEDLLQVADMYSKLINELGLEISKEHLYKKFKIPKPDNMQDVAKGKVNVKSVDNLSNYKQDDMEFVSLKANDVDKSQSKVDSFVDKIIQNSFDDFKNSYSVIEKQFKEVKSLEELKSIFEDEKKLTSLLSEMNTKIEPMTSRLGNGLILSNLTGRNVDE